MRGAHLFELRLKVGEPKKISWVSRCICSIGLTVSAPRRVGAAASPQRVVST
jgi:hypothetical protein